MDEPKYEICFKTSTGKVKFLYPKTEIQLQLNLYHIGKREGKIIHILKLT